MPCPPGYYGPKIQMEQYNLLITPFVPTLGSVTETLGYFEPDNHDWVTVEIGLSQFDVFGVAGRVRQCGVNSVTAFRSGNGPVMRSVAALRLLQFQRSGLSPP